MTLKVISETYGVIEFLVDEDIGNLLKDKNFQIIAYKNTSNKYVMFYEKCKAIRLHRFIMGATTKQIVDHINGNTLDNRKENLRTCDHRGNMRNCKKPKTNTSGYKGVHKRKDVIKNRYVAYISNDGYKCLGYYFTAEEAALAYDKAAIEIYGKFAKLNFPEINHA